MTPERYAEQAQRWIRQTRPEAPPNLPGDRRRLVGAVAGALRGRRRKRRSVRAVGTLGAAAAAILLVTHLDLRPLRHQTPVLSSVKPAAPAVDAHRLSVRDGNGAIALGTYDVQAVKPGMMLKPGF